MSQIVPQDFVKLEVVPATKTNGNGHIPDSLLKTDAGNATRFLGLHGANVRYCHDFKKWLVWKDGIWQIDKTQQVFRLGELTVRSMYHQAGDTEGPKERKALASWAMRCETETRINGMLNIAKARPGVPIEPSQLDSNPWLFTIQSGTIDLKTGVCRSHDKGDHITRQSNVTYDPEARAPRWIAFLERIIPNPEVRTFLQKAVGYSLTGETSEQCMFFLFGLGANGKSTFLDVIHALMGEYSMSTPTSTLTVKQNDAIPNDIARLKGVRFVSAVETDDGKRLAESVLKQLTGDKRISARFMRGEWFDFQPILKLWLATNHKPQVRGTDEGIWRRIRLIPFTVSIPPEEQERNLAELLIAEELPGILNWALEGLRLWLAEGLGTPPAVMAATQEYRQEQDALNSFFEECCIAETGAQITAKELYTRYTSWCEENGERAESQRKFGQRLAERGFTKRKSSVILWLGLRLAKDGEPARDVGRNEDQKTASLIATTDHEGETGEIIPDHPTLPSREPGKETARVIDMRNYGPPLRACFTCRKEDWYYDPHGLGEGRGIYRCRNCQPPTENTETT
jgi:putative DNA primase/helicase